MEVAPLMLPFPFKRSTSPPWRNKPPLSRSIERGGSFFCIVYYKSKTETYEIMKPKSEAATKETSAYSIRKE